MFPGVLCQRILKHGRKIRKKLTAVKLNIINEIKRKFLLVSMIAKLAENQAEKIGDSLRGNSGLDPAIKAEGRHLPFQNGRGVEKAAGRFDAAGDHLFRFRIEIKIMRSAVGHGKVEGVPGLAPGAPDALHIVGLGRRYGTENHGGKVADVDPELQGGCTGKKIGRTGGWILDHEAFLQCLPLVPFQKPRMLRREDSLHIAFGIEGAVIVRARRFRDIPAPA